MELLLDPFQIRFWYSCQITPMQLLVLYKQLRLFFSGRPEVKCADHPEGLRHPTEICDDMPASAMYTFYSNRLLLFLTILY